MKPRPRWIVLVLLVGGSAAAMAWPWQAAEDPVVEDLVWRIRRPSDPARRAAAMERLRTHGTDESLLALVDLLLSADDRIALLAIDAVEKADPGLAGRELRAVFADPVRSEVVRAAAGAAWYRVELGRKGLREDLQEELRSSTEEAPRLRERVLEQVRRSEATDPSPATTPREGT